MEKMALLERALSRLDNSMEITINGAERVTFMALFTEDFLDTYTPSKELEKITTKYNSEDMADLEDNLTIHGMVFSEYITPSELMAYIYTTYNIWLNHLEIGYLWLTLHQEP